MYYYNKILVGLANSDSKFIGKLSINQFDYSKTTIATNSKYVTQLYE